MFWVLKRTVSMRRFFWATNTNVRIDGQEIVLNFTLKHFWLGDNRFELYLVENTEDKFFFRIRPLDKNQN